MLEEPTPSRAARWADQALEALLFFFILTGIGSVVALFCALALWLWIDAPVTLGVFFKSASLLLALLLIIAMGWWKRLPWLLVGGAMLLCLLLHWMAIPLYFWPAALLVPIHRQGA